ncbi:MAG: hypothetical protein QOG51_1880 [Verrucomicrobiota bacterium]|jgi:hypothetical protein
MKRNNRPSGFAIAFTLVLMALIVIIVVAYLASTRIERATSSVYANRLRAKATADSGLTAAIHLLRENTRYGNYITALPAALPAPAPLYTELYRPTNPADPSHATVANDYLRLDNAAGEILVSRAIASSAPGPNPRPTPDMVYSLPTPTPLPAFAVPSPNPLLSSSNSYDFNQIVRVGNTDTGRLVDPGGQTAFGQWVNVRNSTGDLVGRYAFFIEDESMKVNVNVAGNNLGPGPSNLRLNDLLPIPASTPTSQIQEVDPSAILATVPAPPPSRSAAVTALATLAAPGARLVTRSSLALLPQWNSSPSPTPFVNYAHIVTTNSKDDDTTARGWKRLDLNKIVADAQAINTPAAKKAAATEIADWIRDAWTGSTAIATLQDYQMFGEDWLRKQLAANIVDYIDTDNAPTDMGDIIPPGFTIAVPVIGTEKTPYLAGVHIVYEASDSTYPGSGAGAFAATVRMRLQFHFLNLFDTTLDLADAMGNTALSRIEVKGVPIIQKNGSTVYDVSSQTWTVKLSDLTPVGGGTGTTIPLGTDGTSASGARTFQTNWLDTRGVSFTVAATDQNPKFLAQSVTVKIIGNKTGGSADDYRIDDTSIVTSAVTTKYCNPSNCGSAAGDFLKESSSSAGPLRIASINYIAGFLGAIVAGATPGDPRYRGRLVGDRWNNDGSRTDGSGTNNKVDSLIDKADFNPRSYGFDWFDNSGNRPLAFIRNGPLLNIGELGNVATCEYPWRTLYFQYPERPANTVAAGPVTDIPLRRSKAMDSVVLDLFRTNSDATRSGAININTQQRYGSTQQHALAPLFFGELIGTVPSLTQTMIDRLCTATGSASYSPIFDRRIAVGSPPDNTPSRPFFQVGELASVISRLVNTSPGGSATTGSTNRSTVNYSLLRTNPTTANEAPTNANIHQDMQVEQEFREVSNSITTRGNVFRVLYVGQSIRDSNHNGQVDGTSETAGEYFGEAFIERRSVFTPDPPPAVSVRTTDSTYVILTNRVITE